MNPSICFTLFPRVPSMLIGHPIVTSSILFFATISQIFVSFRHHLLKLGHPSVMQPLCRHDKYLYRPFYARTLFHDSSQRRNDKKLSQDLNDDIFHLPDSQFENIFPAADLACLVYDFCRLKLLKSK